MADKELLGKYLTDHLAGSTAGIDMAKNLMEDNEDTPFGSFMSGLVADIEADQHTLQELMDALQIETTTIKQAGSWAAEKLSRLRFKGPVTHSGGLSRLMEMETLSMGIHAKMELWQALREVASTDADPAWSQFDFDTLVERARGQLESLFPHRLRAAATAFEE